MVMKWLRRAAYGLEAWLFVFILVAALSASAPDYLLLVAIAAPVAFYWLAVHCLRRKKPDWGSEGLKAGGAWLLAFGVMDFVLMPLLNFGPYAAYLAGGVHYLVYFFVLVAPWAADKTMTGSRKI